MKEGSDIPFRIVSPYIVLSVCAILISMFYFPSAFCQDGRVPGTAISISEDLAADESGQESIGMFTEKLSELSDDPVNINSADEDEISRLFFLSDFQVKALTDYVHTTGEIYSVYEIQNITGFNSETAAAMLPYISMGEALKTGRRSLSGNLLSNLIFKPGMADTSRAGSPVKYLGKLKLLSGDFSAGLTIEKDQGESFFYGDPPAPDFFSGYFSYTGRNLIRKVIIGDYSARFGHGTCINTGIAPAMSLSSPGNMSAGRGIKEYSSADENSFLRGMAMSLKVKSCSLTAFYSVNNIDASLTGGRDSVKSFYSTGLHNSASAKLKKDAVSDITYGLNVTAGLDKTNLGFTLTEDRLTLPVVRNPDPEKRYSFSGDRNSVISFYYNSVIRRFLLFGEVSVSNYLKSAFFQGFSVRLADRLTLNVLAGASQKGYTSLHGKLPGTGSVSWNEKSLIGNFTFEAAKNLFLSGGCSLRNFPGPRHLCSSPSKSVRQEVRLEYVPADILSVEAIYNHGISASDGDDGNCIPRQDVNMTDHARISARYYPADNFRMNTRIDFKKSGSEKGFAMIQDLSYLFRSLHLEFWYRFCIYLTGGWDSRIYAYENDLLYSYNIPSLYGEGSRSSVMLKYKAGFGEIRIKYSTEYTADASNANSNDLRLQLKLVF